MRQGLQVPRSGDVDQDEPHVGVTTDTRNSGPFDRHGHHSSADAGDFKSTSSRRETDSSRVSLAPRSRAAGALATHSTWSAFRIRIDAKFVPSVVAEWPEEAFRGH